MIPFIDLQPSHDTFLREYFRDLQHLFAKCEFIGAYSKMTAEFECAFAGYLGVKYAIGVASGTDALLLPMHALGIGPGDEVIMPAFGFIATADVVVRLGGRPVLVDVDPVTCNINPSLIEPMITERTKALCPVHLFGLACDMDAIMEIAERRGLAVIEDVAQACGTQYKGRKLGTIGKAGAFSFYPTKNLGGAGDGGMITTNDDRLAETLYKFRDHGRTPDGTYDTIGYNSRLDTVQALYLKRKLEELDETLAYRIDNARLYYQLLKGTEVEVPAVPDDMSHTFNNYTIKVRDRDRLMAYLKWKGVGSAIYYKEAMHLTRALAHLGYKAGDFPVAESLTQRVLSLPVFPGLKRKQIERVAELVKEFLDRNPLPQLG
ncbi:MAG: DegT/DnrJ/EryC1/StrS family aminotransferase [Candidatus Sumerlaeaceae bacterium]|nr:DegT/DnrJ/EryC1/StrS family aminotransferase [Candidatus Sumerlaeaceae bacterium]